MIKKMLNISNNDYIYSVISKVTGVILGFLYSILFARCMGVELNGNASIIQNYVTLFEIILCCGIYQAYPYYKKTEYADVSNEFYIRFIQLSLSLAVIYGCISLFCCYWIHSWNVKVVIIMLPMAYMTKVFHYLVLIETPKKANSLSIILRAVDIVFISSYFMFKNLNLYLCIVFLIIRQFYYCVSSIWILDIKPKELVPKFDKELFKYLRYGFIPMLTILMMTINYKIDTIMLSHSKNVSIAEIGVYALGVSLAEHVWIIPDALKDILLSKLTNGKGEEEVAKICRISLIIILLCILGVAIVGKPIIHIIYGNQYSDAYQVMILITMGGIGMIFYKMIYSYNVINGRRLVNLFLLSSAAIINIVLNAFLIPNHGIIGAAIASLVSYLICGLMFLRYFVKLTNYPWKRIVLVQYEDIIAFIPDKLMKYWNKRCNNIK